jgi:hypothetical protein
MTQDDSKLMGACVLGFGFGLYTFFKGFREFREYRVVADTPTIPIRSVPMGLVQVQGQAKGAQPVTSPVSHTPCYWYRVVIEHWKTDSSRGGRWEHAHTDVDGVKFYLTDATGHIKVDPTSAELDLPQMAQKVAGSAGRQTGGPDEELLRYVTKAGAHSISRFVGRGIEYIHPLADPVKEEKRQMLASAFQSTPGSPEFMQRIMPFVASMAKQKLETAGAQVDPKHEQARQAMLAAFNHQPGSPEFFQALQGAAALGGESPQALSKFQEFLQPENDLAIFDPAQGRYRLTEYCVVPDGTYDITGTCQENPEPADAHDRNMIAKGQNEPTFLISSKTDKQLKSGLRRRAAGKIFGGAALSLVCAVVILAKLGLLF